MKDIYAILDELGISYEKYEHAPAHTVEEAKEIYKDIPGGRVKNVFLRDKKGKKHFLVTMPADKELDTNIIREHLGCSKIGGAQPDELEKYLGVTPGSMTPFALINDPENHVLVFVDEDIYEEEFQHFHPMINTISLVIKTTDLDKFLDNTGNTWEKIAL